MKIKTTPYIEENYSWRQLSLMFFRLIICIIFLIFVNNIVNSTNSKILILADDTKLDLFVKVNGYKAKYF